MDTKITKYNEATDTTSEIDVTFIYEYKEARPASRYQEEEYEEVIIEQVIDSEGNDISDAVYADEYEDSVRDLEEEVMESIKSI